MCVYVCMYVCMYVCIYIYIYIGRKARPELMDSASIEPSLSTSMPACDFVVCLLLLVVVLVIIIISSSIIIVIIIIIIMRQCQPVNVACAKVTHE